MAKFTIEIDDSLAQSFNRFIARNYSEPMTLQQFIVYQIEQLRGEVVGQFPPDTFTEDLQEIEAIKARMRSRLQPIVVTEEPVSPEPIRATLERKS